MDDWRGPPQILGWGGRPSNHGPCRYCGQQVTWALDLGLRPVILEPEPSPAGTILIRRNGTHLADLEDPRYFPPAQAALLKGQGFPLYVRHARLCGRVSRISDPRET